MKNTNESDADGPRGLRRWLSLLLLKSNLQPQMRFLVNLTLYAGTLVVRALGFLVLFKSIYGQIGEFASFALIIVIMDSIWWVPSRSVSLLEAPKMH